MQAAILNRVVPHPLPSRDTPSRPHCPPLAICDCPSRRRSAVSSPSPPFAPGPPRAVPPSPSSCHRVQRLAYGCVRAWLADPVAWQAANKVGRQTLI